MGVFIQKACKAVLCAFIGLAVFLAGYGMYHQSCLRKEQALICHMAGQYVLVDGHNMNVYVDGEGEKTLVFLAGTGTPSPILDFKPLYSRLAGKCRIVVIEKFGYGYSDECEGERSADVITQQDRKALASLGIKPQYILVPHSASGIEAIWWANHYAGEVEAIIGLDNNVPGQYARYKIPMDPNAMESVDMDKAIASNAVYDFFMYKVGLLRLFMNPEKLLPALSSRALTEEEKAQYKAIGYIMYCKGSNSTWQRETVMAERSLEALCEYCNGPLPDIPTLFFVSDGSVMEQAMDPRDWIAVHKDYISSLSKGEIVLLEAGHYLHAEMPEEVSEKILAFLDSLE